MAEEYSTSPSKEDRRDSLLQQGHPKPDISLDNGDETCGCRCGIASKKCLVPCGVLQPLATAKWALVFICIANLLQQTILNGLYGVSVSSLEKRFELRSTESGLISSMGDFSRGIFMFFLMFVSSNVHKPGMIGIGTIVSGIGAIMFAMPHFTAPVYTFVDEDIQNYCGNVTNPDCTQSAVRDYLYWFIFCMILIGGGTCPLFVHGITFLDENVEKRNSALYNSIYLAMGGLGPAIGFVFGGMALELYTYPSISAEDLSIDSSNYLWVGAWWIGFVVCGIITILNSIPLMMLPKYLPGTEEHRKNRDVEAQRSHLQQSGKEDSSFCYKKFLDILLLLKNKPYIFISLANTMNCALIYGFNTFGAKYLESVFGLTPFHSSLLYGVAAIFASAGAQVASGIIIKKYDLQVPGLLKFAICGGIFSALCSIGFLVHCGDIDFAGGNVPYANETMESLSLISSCNENCSCSTDRYEPVCANGITYFSPCFAGCLTKINETAYTDCSCVLASNVSYGYGGVTSSHSCDSKACSMVIPFAFIVFLCFFTSVLTLAPTIQVSLRCVPFKSRDLAMSLQAAVVRMAGIIPGRILVGFVLDSACVSWSTECREQGSCKAYNRQAVARNNTILLLLQTVLCAIFYSLVLFTYKPAGGATATTTDEGKSERLNPDDPNLNVSCPSLSGANDGTSENLTNITDDTFHEAASGDETDA